MRRILFALKTAGLILGISLLTILSGYGQASGVSRNADRRVQPRPSIKASRILSSHHYSSLRLARKEVVSVGVDSLYVDTLVMDDKSTLVFPNNTRIMVNHAVIGAQCSLLAAGQNGREPGSSGEDGRSLEIHMVLDKLGDLAIDTRGGHGAAGVAGKPGESALGYQGMGGNGGPGGNGGHGGALRFFYWGHPVFNGEGNNTITLHYEGGKAGAGGQGGMGGKKLVTDGTGKTTICGSCPTGPKGSSGPGGAPGADGELKFERISH